MGFCILLAFQPFKLDHSLSGGTSHRHDSPERNRHSAAVGACRFCKLLRRTESCGHTQRCSLCFVISSENMMGGEEEEEEELPWEQK